MKLAAMALVCLFSVLMICSTSFGQGNLFSGQGIGSNSKSGRTTAKSGSGLSNLIDFSNNEKPAASTSSSMFKRPSFDFFKSNPFRRDPANGSSMFNSMPSIFPKRDPNAPGFFQQLGQRSRGFFDRTSSWAQEQNQNIRSRTQNTWSSLTTDMQQRQNSMGDFFKEKSGFMTPPPVRASETPGNQPKVRF